MRILSILFLVTAATGCIATASPGYTTTAYVGPSVGVTATVVEPELVYVSPGVQVIADYDEPIFYVDGFYWREYGGVWYRSSYYNRGWVYSSAPYAVVSIRDRRSYSHYRPSGWSPRRGAYRDNRAIVRDNRNYQRPVVRDNRTYQAPVRDHRTEQAPVTRDHRAPARSDKRTRDHR